MIVGMIFGTMDPDDDGEKNALAADVFAARNQLRSTLRRAPTDDEIVEALRDRWSEFGVRHYLRTLSGCRKGER